jgi:zinc protease
MKKFIALIVFALALAAIPAQAAKDKILDVQVVKSKSGIEGWLVQDKTVPVIAISFSFEGGLAFDPDDKPGVGRLVSILLDEGAGETKSQEFQQKLSDNAISMKFIAGRDAFYGNLKTLKENKDVAFDLLRLALTRPRFDAEAVTRMKNANISGIKNDMGDPSWLSARTFNGMMFEGHYYARPGFGNLESMEAITARDLHDYVRAQFGRNVLKVSIVGDITPEEATLALDRIFSGLPEKAEEAEAKEAALTNVGKTILLPLDTPQTYIIVGQAGIARADKDWHAATVMNYILGGGSFDARLMKEIRDKRGLTYGVYSTLSSQKYASALQVNMSASNEKVEESLRVMRDQWSLMAEKGPSESELKDAKAYITGSLFLSLTSTDDIAELLNSLQRDGETPDYINRRNKIISDLTIAEVRAVAKRLLVKDNLTTVLVGKPQNINVDILLDRPPGMKAEEKTAP